MNEMEPNIKRLATLVSPHKVKYLFTDSIGGFYVYNKYEDSNDSERGLLGLEVISEEEAEKLFTKAHGSVHNFRWLFSTIFGKPYMDSGRGRKRRVQRQKR